MRAISIIDIIVVVIVLIIAIFFLVKGYPNTLGSVIEIF